MVIRTVCAFICLGLGVSAVAMPAWDGQYSCSISPSTETVPVMIATKDNKLFAGGALNLGGMAQSGIPCEDKQESQAMQGTDLVLGLKTSCTNEALETVISMIQPTEKTDFKFTLSFKKTSDQTMDISMSAQGMVKGRSVERDMVINCTK